MSDKTITEQYAERIIELEKKVEEMQKALDRIHTDSTDSWAVGYSLRVLQALKGGETK